MTAQSRPERYHGAYVWLAFSSHGDEPELYEACENKVAAMQALDERLNCYDLRDWAVVDDWRVGSTGADGVLRSWLRTIKNSNSGDEGSQVIRREPIRVELADDSGDGDLG